MSLAQVASLEPGTAKLFHTFNKWLVICSDEEYQTLMKLA
jgi:hypothetical protein